MKAIMPLKELTTIDQLEQFLNGSQICVYEVHSGADERYQWIEPRNLSWITKVCATPGQRLAKAKNAEQPTRLPVIFYFH